jgi:hypothetical protein
MSSRRRKSHKTNKNARKAANQGKSKEKLKTPPEINSL